MRLHAPLLLLLLRSSAAICYQPAAAATSSAVLRAAAACECKAARHAPTCAMSCRIMLLLHCAAASADPAVLRSLWCLQAAPAGGQAHS